MKTLDDIELARSDREAVQAAAVLLRQHFPVARIVLFGSKATGRDDPESDIDLLVVTSRAMSWREQDALTDAVFDVEMQFHVIISTLIVWEEEWERGWLQVLPIREEIERTGVAA